MKNRVKVIETKFYVNEEKRTVVCKITGDIQVHKCAGYEAIRAAIPGMPVPGQFTVEGKAKCNATDTFDEKTGKMIAEGRAKARMLSTASKVWSFIGDLLGKYATECLDLSNACLETKRTEEKHVIELSK